MVGGRCFDKLSTPGTACYLPSTCKWRTYTWIMNSRISINFLLIALVQGLHSIEEFFGKLWEVYLPATFLSGLVSTNLKPGFIIINFSLFIILMLTWLTTFSKSYSTRGILWIWIILETIRWYWAYYMGNHRVFIWTGSDNSPYPSWPSIMAGKIINKVRS